MSREALARLLGEALTARLRSGAYWCVTPAGVRVRELAADVAADLEGKVTVNE